MMNEILLRLCPKRTWPLNSNMMHFSSSGNRTGNSYRCTNRYILKMKLKFRDLGKLVQHRNRFLPGIERSDSTLRLSRHRLANNKLMTAKISSEDVSCLEMNSFWNADSFNSWRIQRAIHQYPQSSTE